MKFSDEAVDVWPAYRLRDVALFIFRSLHMARIGFVIAILAHLLEAIVALQLAMKMNLEGSDRIKWFVQTLALGFPSLRIILWLQRQRDIAKKAQ
jgi:hypothetical protein